jgi:circadian clock protein KaiB
MKRAAKKLVLRLYVAGRGPNSLRALSNLRAICGRHLGDEYELEVIDVVSEPGRVVSGEVLVTPTLLRLKPEPVQTILGDLSDEVMVVSALGLDQAKK